MNARDEIFATLRRQRRLLSTRYPIHRLALFGSWARGDARANSDVDGLIEIDGSIGLRFVDLADEIEKALGRPFDLVSRRSINPSQRALSMILLSTQRHPTIRANKRRTRSRLCRGG